MFQNLLILIVTDVWSAIRKAGIYRLGPLLNQFHISILESFFSELIKVRKNNFKRYFLRDLLIIVLTFQICQDKKASWQSVEGAIMAINSIVRKFHWKSTGVGVLLSTVLPEEDKEEEKYFLMV